MEIKIKMAKSIYMEDLPSPLVKQFCSRCGNLIEFNQKYSSVHKRIKGCGKVTKIETICDKCLKW